MLNASEVSLPFFQALTSNQLSSPKTHRLRNRPGYIRTAFREGLVQPPFTVHRVRGSDQGHALLAHTLEASSLNSEPRVLSCEPYVWHEPQEKVHLMFMRPPPLGNISSLTPLQMPLEKTKL